MIVAAANTIKDTDINLDFDNNKVHFPLHKSSK